MFCRRLMVLVLPALLAGIPVFAADPMVERILRDLRALGYSDIAVEQTLLGRTRIVADSRDASREIIVNPATGEILRDLWIPRVAEAGASSGLLGGEASSSGKRDDDQDDGDGEDDNSGSGSDDSDEDSDDDGGKGRGRGGDNG